MCSLQENDSESLSNKSDPDQWDSGLLVLLLLSQDGRVNKWELKLSLNVQHPLTEKRVSALWTQPVSASVFPACSLLWCSSAPANDLASSGASIGRAADKTGGERKKYYPPSPGAAAGAMTQDRTETDGVESGSVLLQRPVKTNFLIMI